VRGRGGRRPIAGNPVPAALGALVFGCAPAGDGTPPAAALGAGGEAPVIRIATFNIEELSAARLDDAGPDGAGRDPAALAAAAIVQRVRPDLLVVNEIDVDPEAADPAANARRFADRYLARGAHPIDFPHAFAAPSNTGLPTGLDLDRDGRVAGAEDRGTRGHGDDSFGYGAYPGQYAMALLSRHPIDAEGARTFQRFLWRDLPGHHLPLDHYRPEAVAILRLSSKSHWDVPVSIAGRRLHLWISHPTPPAFDGPEDRNGRRNFDEIKFWVDYLAGSAALYDDRGRRGGYAEGEPFVIAGDLNSDPDDGVAYDGVSAIGQLLRHPHVHDPSALLTSRGAAEHRRLAIAAGHAAGAAATAADLTRRTHPERATAAWLGGRRVDYLLPSAGLEVVGGGVFWPAAEEDPEAHALAEAASDHRLVWLDLRLDRGRGKEESRTGAR